MPRHLLTLLAFLSLLPTALRAAEQPAADQPARPNIVYILCDDLGYGDVRAFNPDGKIPTPHMDALAAAGMRFTDMHSGSAVCSPTRYGVLTGRYAWRSRLQNGVLGGLSPRLIEPGRVTVASFLKEHGYHTACIGKWHLGMDWVKKPGKNVTELGIESVAQVWNVDYAQPISNGPNAVGFDEYYGISASLDMVPYTFIENDRVAALPTLEKSFPLYLGRGGPTRKGPAAPDFEAEDVLPRLTEKAVAHIESRAADAGARTEKPFFLYLPLASPHTPIAPQGEWKGKSKLGHYADFVMATDDAIGQVVAAIDKAGLADNTLVIVTSDNGCSPRADFKELAGLGHDPSHVYRGHKADIFEGGHRIPFIARWPARVKAGSQSDQTLCLTDLLATTADILGQKLPDTAGEDSVSILPALEGRAKEPLREAVVHHSINGSFAIRTGPWKLCLTPSSGGWSVPRPADANALPRMQLYHMADDIGEKQNLIEKDAERAVKMTALLQRYVELGRSTPGLPQKNTVPVQIYKERRAGSAPNQK